MLGVVVPTRNEAASIGALVAQVRAALPGATILVVDDRSPDDTAGLARAAGAEVLTREGPPGMGRAYRDGFAYALAAGFDPIVQMDADLSHDPADVPRLVAALDQADLVLGSRWVAGGGTVDWDRRRRLLSRFGSAYARAWLGLPQRDLTGGFKAWRAETLRNLEPATLRAEGYAFQVEATFRAIQRGARVVEVPIVFTERRAGASKMSSRIAIEAAWRIPGLR
jgi:dolichol-phosphate mannosyltransferase